MDKKERLIDVFRDTEAYYTENPTLAAAVRRSAAQTKFYPADDYPPIPDRAELPGRVTVSRRKTFESAVLLRREYPRARIAVLNFASATTPGGGVRKGASAQEEGLCRCSTLYPALDQQRLWDAYYLPNRAAADPLHTDDVIWTPDVVICKTDDTFPQRLDENDFVTVDVLTCAAPNLRSEPSNAYNLSDGDAVTLSAEALYALHVRRAKHILHIAALHGAEALVLGAFGCGAFRNDPHVVAKAYADTIRLYAKFFRQIDFAVFCREWETENFDAFRQALEK